MRCAVAHVLTAALLASPPALADGVLVRSKQPYWKVGPRDTALSRACSLGRFGMARPGRFIARFSGTEGAETLGIAKGSGLNLRDPGRLAKPNEDYYFRNHGTTECEVFVGGRKGAPKG
jgi:hypothetical protein